MKQRYIFPLALVAGLTSSLFGQIIYDADFSVEGDGFPDHTTSTPPAAAPVSINGGSDNTTQGEWSVSYTSTPGSDGSANEFSVNNGVLRIQDWGGESQWLSESIDVSSIDLVEINGIGLTIGNAVQNGSTEFFEWFYVLDGGPEVVNRISLAADIEGTSVDYQISDLDVSTANSLSVGFRFNVNGGGDGYEISSVTVAVPTADLSAPVISSTSPDGTTLVATDSNLIASFDEDIQAGTGFIQIVRVSDSNVFASYDVATAPEISFSGSDLIINPSIDLEPSTEFTVLIPNGAIVDLAETPNGFAGNVLGDWSFTTAAPPIPEPTPIAFTPTSGTIDVSFTPTLEIVFDEPIYLNAGNIFIKDASNDSVVQTIDVATLTDPFGSSATLTVPITTALAGGVTYYVDFEAGIVQDEIFTDCLAFDGSSTWLFSTQAPDLTAPVLESRTPFNGSQTVNPSTTLLSLDFDEAIVLGSGSFSVYLSPGGELVTSVTTSDLAVTINDADPTIVNIDLSGSLSQEADYYVLMDAGFVTDISGNIFDGFSLSSDWTFSTPGPPPAIVITEIMQDPVAVNDGAGEYFEIYNPNDFAVDLNGWTVADADFDSFTINNGGPLEIQAGGYLLFAVNGDSLVNGGLPAVDYVYSGMFLSNSSDEIILFDTAMQEVDRVFYNNINFPNGNGTSMELTDPTLDNNDGANWQLSSSSYGAGDLGTPGDANSTPPSNNKFSDWADGFPGLGVVNRFDDDFDKDGIPNGLEHIFGTDPTNASSSARLRGLERRNANVIFQHRRAKELAEDVILSYEWSLDLTNWNADGASVDGTTVTFSNVVSDTSPIDHDLVDVTASVSGTPANIFVRSKAQISTAN